jgi:hypothetical protein
MPPLDNQLIHHFRILNTAGTNDDLLPISYNFKFKRETRKANPLKLYWVSDGDTPVIEQPIRMVSCDTPEKAGYAGKPETSRAKLNKCKQRLQSHYYDGRLPKGLRDYLIDKITPDAAQRHIDAGNDATKEFEAILEERLTLPNGKKQQVGIISDRRDNRCLWQNACVHCTLFCR